MAEGSIPVPGGLGGARIPETARPEAVDGTWLETLHSWVITVDHKKLGILYMLYALIFLVVGGIEAMIIRIQLFFPDNHFVSPEMFNRLFTMHGTTMVFFVAMPIVFGFGNYLMPLMMGARDMAFPRLNAFSFWMSRVRRAAAVLQLYRRSGPARDGECAGCGLVCVCAADGAGVLARALRRTTGRWR